LPAPSLSVSTIIGLFLASALMRAAFSFFLNSPKPSVVIICASITFSRRSLSYLPSTMTGKLIFNFSILFDDKISKDGNAENYAIDAKGGEAVLFDEVGEELDSYH